MIWRLLLCLLLLAGPADAAVVWFAGAETGDMSEFSSSSVFGVAQGSPTPHNGQYYIHAPHDAEADSATGLNLATLWVRLYLQVAASPSADNLIFQSANTGSTHFLRLFLKTDRTVYWNYDAAAGSAVASGATVLSTATWHLIEAKLVISASVGGMEVKIDGTTQFTSFGTNTSSSGNINKINFGPAFHTVDSLEYNFDDMAVSDSGYIGAGGSIARQGTTGTPTYTAWTKNSCTSSLIQNCWSNTPFSTASSASSSTTNASQTMLNASFGTVQTGHGTETIAAHDTINGCKAAMVAKSGTASAPISIRRSLSGSDTDTAKTLTTSDAYYDDGVWTTTPDVLRNLGTTMEIGVLHGSGTATDTVEDMWMICDYALFSGTIRHRVTQ